MKDSILKRWQLTDVEFSNIVDSHPSLRGFIVGYVAEYKLREMLKRHPDVEDISRADDHDRSSKGDLTVHYKNSAFRVEVKSLQTHTIRQESGGNCMGMTQCDASDRRIVRLPNGKKMETTCLVTNEFDVLAVNLFGFTGKWLYGFALNEDLPRTTYAKYPPSVRRYLIKTLIPVRWPLEPPFRDEPFSLFDRLLSKRSKRRR